LPVSFRRRLELLESDRSAERDLHTTVLTNVRADIWAALKFISIRETISGFGRLLEELP
jgi:maleate cis-trans isomerase